MYESFDDAVASIYREVVAESGDEAIKKQEAFDVASERVTQLVLDGVIDVPANAAIRAALEVVDKSDRDSVSKVLRAMSAGQDPLDYADDPMLDRVAIVGDGLRKTFRYVAVEDLREMDSLRYRNLRSAQESYHAWRMQYEAWEPCVKRHGTVGAAVAAGDVPEFDI